ncbi:MAG TPA: DsbA family protein [Kofleriaceae bacterium]|jgi:2-hydroxychromene-2-carboxylate isomerase|nr:DsbA family protein [Kofleriaceae bacterium]
MKVDFFFDLSSPYSYLAATQVPAIAARTGAEFVWKPFVLAAVFKATNPTSDFRLPTSET